MEGTKWNVFIPWFLTIACTVTLIIIGKFLLNNIEWYKESVFNKEVTQVLEPGYRFHAYHLHLSMVKRSVGLFSGFAVMFLGLGVAFFTLKNNTSVEASSAGLTTKLITASPGIVALLVGAYIIISTIDSKDTFPAYGEVEQDGLKGMYMDGGGSDMKPKKPERKSELLK